MVTSCFHMAWTPWGDEARKSGEALPELGEKEPEPGDEQKMVKPCQTMSNHVKPDSHRLSQDQGMMFSFFSFCFSFFVMFHHVSYHSPIMWNIVFSFFSFSYHVQVPCSFLYHVSFMCILLCSFVVHSAIMWSFHSASKMNRGKIRNRQDNIYHMRNETEKETTSRMNEKKHVYHRIPKPTRENEYKNKHEDNNEK